MGLILIGLTFLAGITNLNPSYKEAADTSRRALMADKDNQRDIDRLADKSERWARRNTGLSKDELAYFAYASPVFTQSISTKPFKGLKKTLPYNMVVRPEITYRWDGNPEKFSGILVLTFDF